eukprot:XP_014782039.1 PREDICTED: uncharacterized protein LOC106877608 [Octopus bimaculoides]
MNQVINAMNMKFPKVGQISTSDLDIWLNNKNEAQPKIPKPEGKIVVLDVRPLEEYEVSHLKNSTRVDHNIENIGQFVNSFTTPDSKEPLTFACYCSVGYRSSLLGTRMLDFFASEGITNINVFNVEGSLFKWGNEHRPMYNKNEEATVFVHPFNKVWGKLLDAELRKEKI